MTPAERAARERKQKIFVVVGGILLLGLLAFQLPRMLGGSSSPAAAPATDTTLASDPATPAPRSIAAVALVDTDRRLGPIPGKLTSFSVFARKDPFIQQVVPDSPFGDPAADGDTKKDTPKTARKGFTVGSPAAKVTIISVNGSRQTLEPGAAFPASDPVFVLVAEQPDASTAVVGIAGGAYASGAKTTKLKAGKPTRFVDAGPSSFWNVLMRACSLAAAFIRFGGSVMISATR